MWTASRGLLGGRDVHFTTFLLFGGIRYDEERHIKAHTKAPKHFLDVTNLELLSTVL